ncbi:SWIM zinc finger family protein [Clostridium sp. FP2]|uniref:SWIM zinc finger family protein n=1 Tax=Clostridium TaxID=1485 RepID=UPI0013E9482B|nr:MULTISPECIES: SWIM zinc finger family protein [Clostridium]MBW9157737.1 SWIM zinc finger family protein [Clostridium tagluense]MBZ9622520.1 SWIM zinc finger family protein [Clostridium sp. FP2]WLC66811.1 SWIM zinc finger family protein [Clostridium tagluense]
MTGRIRNEFGINWWSKKWNNAISSFTISSRIDKGREYARAGNVLSMEVLKGEIIAEVQGGRLTPYTVNMEIDIFSKEQWKNIMNIMAQKAIFCAMILNGEMPENIEEAFKEAGVSLFPKKQIHLITHCSCPDAANPCKHIAAVHYLLGLEFDKDPFVILKLRGMDKEEFLKALRILRSGNESDVIKTKVKKQLKSKKTIVDLKREFENSNGIDEEVLNMSFSYVSPEVVHGVIKTLGIPDFCTSEDEFGYKMRKAYSNAEEETRKYIDGK